MVQHLTVRARGTALVSDFDALDRPKPLRRFIGRQYVQDKVTGRWGFMPTGKPEQVRHRSEVLKAVRDGDLWAADEDTAKVCGVRFDPTFGEPPAPPAPASDVQLAAPTKATKKFKQEAGAAGGKGDV